MNNDGLATYETWDMTAPVIPPRSRLFHINPVGLGTPLVECLTSYISRVAQAHSISPGALPTPRSTEVWRSAAKYL
jgi:hypothetical protein